MVGDLAALAAGGSTLAERLAGQVMPDPGADSAVGTTRLAAWCAASADGDDAAFARRLQWDGLDAERVLPLLGAVQWPEGCPLPSWVGVVEDAAVSAGRHHGDDPVRRSGAALPFEEVLLPFVRVARDRLARTSARTLGLLEPQARAELERHLLSTLTALAAPTLHLEFTVHRAVRSSAFARLLARVEDPGRTTEYRAFTGRLLSDLPAFLRGYPVLGRLIARAADQWVGAITELLDRLERDAADLRRVFGNGRAIGTVARIEPGLSDPHHGGRTVLALSFSSGVEVMYKPKDVGTEHAFGALLAWLGERGAPLPFRVLTVLARRGYGWVERVVPAPCRDGADAVRFYRRAGMLLALVHLLAGTDCHRGNLMACGDQPVLLDAECLLHPRALPLAAPDGAAAIAQDELEETVLGTGLLPRWELELDATGEQRATDISGLHTADPAELTARALRWTRMNTDHMAQETRDVLLPLPPSQPTLDGVPLRLEEHLTEVLDGFEQCYRFLLAHRDALLAAGGPLDDLGRQTVRFVHRNTSAYGWLHLRLCDPAYLRDGAARSVELDWLARTVTGAPGAGATAPAWWPIVAAEREQLERLDVPIFHVSPVEDVIRLPSGEVLGGCLREPGLVLMKRRLGALGEADLKRQLGLAAGALYGHAARDSAPTPPPAAVRAAVPDDLPADPALLDGAAARAAATLAESAVRAPDGSVTWVAPQYLPAVDRYQLQPVGWDVNTGICGIALFLAAMETAGAPTYRDLVLGALQPLRHALHEDAVAVTRKLGLGGATGVGSVVYALTRIGRWLEEPRLLDDASVAARAVSEELIEQEPVDVFVGAAGAVLGLLALHGTDASDDVLDRAVACARHILAGRTESDRGPRAWATVGGRLLTGFSHGAAGIAYALLRLHAVTGDRRLRSAAEEALAYEDAVFDTSASNWPDLREDRPAFRSDWCHGAPGIGLARLGGLPVLDTPGIRRDVEVAVQAVLRTDTSGPDYVCCGNLGRADVLLVAGDRLARPDLLSAAVGRAGAVVARAGTSGDYLLHAVLPAGVPRPVFFQGLAGVGYQLLRTSRPTSLPSVLLWE